MTMNEARHILTDIPVDKRNNNCVQDGQWRLREALKLADNFYGPDEVVPDYVLKAVKGLQSWL